MENNNPSEGKDPSAFLSEIIGAPVTVKLNSGVIYKGYIYQSGFKSDTDTEVLFQASFNR